MYAAHSRRQDNNNSNNTDNEQEAPQRLDSNFVPQQLNYLWDNLNRGFYNTQRQAVNNYGRTNTSATTNNSGWAWLSLQTDNMKHRVLSNSKEYKAVKNALKAVSNEGSLDDITALRNACRRYLTSTLGLTYSCDDEALRTAVQNSNKKTTTGQVRLMWVYFMWEKHRVY